MEQIIEFVQGGGKYLGSCAGAYFPLTARPSSPETRMWLYLLPATDSTGLDYWRTGTGFVRIMLSADNHPTLNGLSYGNPSTLDVIYWDVQNRVGLLVRISAWWIASNGAIPNQAAALIGF
jgi:hypothetical protein